MNENFTRTISEKLVQQQDKMVEQFLVNNGVLTNADPNPIQIEQLRKTLEERGFKLLETKEYIGGTTKVKLELVKILDTLQYSVTFKIDGVNFK